MKDRLFLISILLLVGQLYAQNFIVDPWRSVVSYDGGTTIVCKILLNGDESLLSGNDRILVTVDGEIRGKTQLTSLHPYSTGFGRSFLVQTNTHGETFEFYLWRFSDQTIYRTSFTLASNPGGTYGGYLNLVLIDFTLRTVSIMGNVFNGDMPLAGINMAIMHANPAYDLHLYSTHVTNSSGRYLFPGIALGSTFGFFPQSTVYGFSPEDQSYTNLQTNQTRNFFVDMASFFSVSGHITYEGIGVDGVSVHTTTTNSAGYYHFNLRSGNSVTLTPIKSGWSFAPPTHQITGISSNTSVNFTAIPTLYTISGNTTLPYVTVFYTSLLSTGSSVVSDINGDYTITGIPHGDIVTITPTQAGVTFSPISRTITNISDNHTGVNFIYNVITYTISGYVRHLTTPIGGVSLYRDTTRLAVTNALGRYTFEVEHGSDITYRPISDGYTFYPVERYFANVISPQSQDFEASPIPQHTVTVSTAFLGDPINDVDIAYVVSGGAFGVKSIVSGGTTDIILNETTSSITFTPTKTGYDFTPVFRTLPNLLSDTSISFTASIHLYTITGNAGESGVTITVTGDHTYTTTTGPGGGFSIPGVPFESGIVITPSMPGYTFVPPSITITSIDDDINLGDVFTPVPITYSVTVRCLDFNGIPIPGVEVIFESLSTTHAGSGVTLSSGNFVFQGRWNQNYQVTVGLSGHIFDPPTKETGTMLAPTTLPFNTRPRTPYTLSGMITLELDGSPMNGVTVSAASTSGVSGAGSLVAGQYSFTVYEGESFAIVPSLLGYTFTPSGVGVTYVNDDIVQDFAGEIAIYSLEGIVLYQGLPVSDVAVSFNAGMPDTTQSDGLFSFTAEHGTSVSIVPTKEGYFFSPTSFVRPTLLSPVTNIVFHAHKDSLLVHGNVTLNGAPLPGVRIFDEYTDKETFTNALGQYEYWAYFGDDINLLAQKPWHWFDPENGHLLLDVRTGHANVDFIASAKCADVTFSVAPGVHHIPISVALSSETAAVSIYYTTDGSIPTEDAILYVSPIPIPNHTQITINARAFKSQYTPSDVATATYSVTGTLAPPTISTPSGAYTSALLVEMDAEQDAMIFYTLDGTTPTLADSVYTAPIFINKNAHLRAFAYKSDYISSTVASAIYQINHIMTLELPDTIYLNRNGQITLNFENYITDSVTGPHIYSISTLTSPANVFVTTTGNLVTFTPQTNWHGTNTAVFKMEYIPTSVFTALDGTLSVSPEHASPFNVAIDTLQIHVNPGMTPPYIVGYFPLADTLYLAPGEEHFFSVSVTNTLDISFDWSLNDTLIVNQSNFLVVDFEKEGIYKVRVVVHDEDFLWENVWVIVVKIVSEVDVVREQIHSRIIGNYPNPFNPQTTILFSIDRTQDVRLSIYNIKGQLVKDLANHRFPPGEHTMHWNATGQSSGIYFLMLRTESTTQIKKMILLK